MQVIGVSAADYGPHHSQHFFDQYKMAVEMADRMSARRMQANTFFLTTNTALLTLFAVLAKDNIVPGVLDALLLVALVAFCFVWRRIVHSFRQLNSGKFKVILEMEKHLPSAPYAAEWVALGEGKDRRLYLPLTNIEDLVPLFFAILYFCLLAVLFLTGQHPGLFPLG